ncbi:response regulator transcription factor [Lysinibacter cavernae]|uniref:DNA-binding NarL/FixJ family response regulator n=1 Tax=Lysinibacter cavernae TaxID=1640652 RepID=A0A7X5TU85_9MICO|nr:response regulator transcription factor [Lysinibacter cavernae]NIH54309.1 DNA-binding NarL/FixJ family response regulator [Lysinibacter cavernae]
MSDMSQAPIRVLLVDDQELIRMGFRLVIDSEDDLAVVGDASDGIQALASVASLAPDVVLMDVRMPGMDGIEATRQIAAKYPASKVIILTTFDLDEYAFAGLRAGASGFLLKDAKPVELLAAIRAVHAGDAAVAPRVTKRMIELFGNQLPGGNESSAGAGNSAERLAVLTDREREVFIAMAEGFNNAEIAQNLFLSESTVKTHVGRVLLKLELRDRVHAVILAHQINVV